MNWSNRIVISCLLAEMNSFQVGHRTTRAKRISSFLLSLLNFILFQFYYFYVAFTLAGHVVHLLVEMNSFQVGHRTTRANRISNFPLSLVNFILFQFYYFYFTLAGHVVQKVNIFICNNQLF